jgi:hypothetical protein
VLRKAGARGRRRIVAIVPVEYTWVGNESVGSGDYMLERESNAAYRTMNAADRSAFRKWLLVNTIVGAFSVLALVAITSMHPGDGSSEVATQSQPIRHAQAR